MYHALPMGRWSLLVQGIVISIGGSSILRLKGSQMVNMTAEHPGTGMSKWSNRIGTRLIVPCYALGGLVLGVIARAWMRWISTDPEFTWSGSIFIVIGFIVFFTGHSIVLVGRQKGWSRTWLTTARVVAAILSLGIFGAAGASMLPTVLTASLGLGRTDWPRPVRRVLIVLSLIIPFFIVRDIGSDFGWNLVTAGRIILYVLIYNIIISAARITVAPQADSWRMNRVVRATILIIFAGAILAAVISVVLS
jgi:hypothetical protein